MFNNTCVPINLYYNSILCEYSTQGAHFDTCAVNTKPFCISSDLLKMTVSQAKRAS